jgi:aubergine-like protein
MENIAEMVIKCITEFVKINKRIPSTIVFYRDGVGKGQYDLVQAIEISKIKKELEKKYLDKCPKLDFILVNKRINDRFYQDNAATPGAKGGKFKKAPKWGKNNHYNKPIPKVKNPESGTMIVDHCTSDTHSDFFMIAQNVTQGTATPTHYTFLNKESVFTMDTVLTMTYF